MMIQEGVAVGRTFAALKDYQVDGNKEMMAIGIMNIVGSCTSCYITTGEKNEKKMINEYSSPIYAFHSMDMWIYIIFSIGIDREPHQMFRSSRIWNPLMFSSFADL